jgi:pyrroline-5-carboxylate reductase
MPHSIGFIGGGNMAASLIGGLLADGLPPERIHVSEPDPERRQFLATRFGLRSTSGTELATSADILVLAVKPQVMQAVARELAVAVSARKPLVISVAAGIRTADLSRWLGGHAAIVRAMPNPGADPGRRHRPVRDAGHHGGAEGGGRVGAARRRADLLGR